MGVDAVAVAERALAWLSLYQAVGAALFVALFLRGVPTLCERVRRIGGLAACIGGVLLLAQLPLMAARMAGDSSGLTNANLLHLALHSSQARSCGGMLLGLVLLAIGLLMRGARVSIWFGIGLATISPTLTGHTSVHAHRALLAPLLSAHVLIGAFWLGSLWPLLLTVRFERPTDAVAVLQKFSRMAGWLVPCLALAGLGMAFLLIGDWSVLRRPYGELLLGKLGVFALLLALAAVNRWRFTPMMSLAPAAARRALQRSIITEYLLIAAVLGMTATLTTLFGPED